MSKPAKWILHCRPEPENADDATNWRRLRAFLKCALRSFDIRCVDITLPDGKSVEQESEAGK